ncbi:hypothetical protein RHGRI_014791 [Rhododendron griersonianum]|uniref:non-specific serine/threonine protein kinase n=1 Tax=Rhododendron griersonianum TaxID=479676 RepID=A0AAV6KB97_9ERIC|nr:hypothetical protein RHGRI_014791 [Rhododendron griersonianum]
MENDLLLLCKILDSEVMIIQSQTSFSLADLLPSIIFCLNLLAMTEDENQFVYNGFDGAHIKLDGAQTHSNGLLQLTNTSKQQIGHAFYQLLIRFIKTFSSRLRQDLSFSTHFVFAIVPEITNLSCWGMTFAISPSMNFTQAVENQYFGLLNSSNNGLPSNHLLAIELDNLTNPEFNDTNVNHFGINVSAIVTYYSNRERINLELATYENQFVYNGFKGAPIHLDGVAKIHSNGLLQLTNFSKQIGHAFYKHPIRFDTSSSTLPQALSFSTHFVFAIVPGTTNQSADGMAFAISPSTNFTHATGNQYLGLLNTALNTSSNNLLAIELDTYENPELHDINDNHVGIDVNSLESNVSANVTYYSNTERINRSLELVSGSPMQAWVEYDGFENVLNVTLAPIKSPRPDQSLLSTRINLSSILLDSMYVGFSAATGPLSGNHYILGWSFNKSGKAQGLDISKLPSLPHQRKPGLGSTGLGITVSVAIVVIGLTITIGGTFYVLRRKKYQEICEDWEREYGPHRFSYKDLFKATRGFIDEELLGAGGFGKVYRGVLPSSKEQVAVKKVSHDSKQGMKEFVAEIASMGRLRHRNLVQLLGYSQRKGKLLLSFPTNMASSDVV